MWKSFIKSFALVGITIMLVISLFAAANANNVTAVSPDTFWDLGSISIPSDSSGLGLHGVVAVHPTANQFGYAADGNFLHVFRTADDSHHASVAIPSSTPFTVADVTNSVDGGRLYVVGWTKVSGVFIDSLYVYDTTSPGSPTYLKTLSDTELGPHSTLFAYVRTPSGDPGHYFVLSGHGWLKLTTATDAVVDTVDFGTQRVFHPSVSPDGTRIYGQKGDTVSGDTLYAMDATSGIPIGSRVLPSSFTFGDAGGGTHYTDITGSPEVFLFVGDSAIEGQQRTVVLDVGPTGVINPQNVLNSGAAIKGGSWAVDSSDGSSIVVSQNRNLTGGGQNSGLTVLRLEETGSGWEQTDALEINPSGGNVEQIAGAPLKGKYYVTDRAAGVIRVVADVNPNPTVSLVLDPDEVDEGSSTTAFVTFEDASDPPQTHNAVIDWGDGTGFVDLGTVTSPFTVSHAYADDNPSVTSSDEYEVSVVITDSGGASGSAPREFGDNLFENGDITDGLSGWIEIPYPLGTGSNRFLSLVASDPPFTDVLQINSVGMGGTGGSTSAEQVFDLDVSQLSSIVVEGDVKSISSTVTSGCGFAGDEAPVVLLVRYTDTSALPHAVGWTFSHAGGSCFSPPSGWTHTPVTQNAWHHFETPNLLAAIPDMASLDAIRVQGRGWDFVGRADNLELLVESAPVVITVNNVDPVVGLSLSEANVDEGDTVTGTVTWTDAGVQDTHSVAVDCGDTSVTPDITSVDQLLDSATFSCTYPDDDPSGTTSDTVYVTATVTDDDNGSGQATGSVTVNNVDPVVGLSLSEANVDEGDTVTGTVTWTDAGVQDTHSVAVDCGDTSVTPDITSVDQLLDSATFSCTYPDDDPSGTTSDTVYVTATVTDDDNGSGQATGSVTVNNVDPAVGDIGAPTGPILVGTEISASASFTDIGAEDLHSAVWNWGDGTTSTGIVTSVSGSGTVVGTHTYMDPGIHTINLLVEDDDTGQGNAAQFQFVVVVDPGAGFPTGGGWLVPGDPTNSDGDDSLPALDGVSQANFGFVVKYGDGWSSAPRGELQFQHRVSEINLHSIDLEWLVVTDDEWAIFRGRASLRDSAEIYPFEVEVRDSKADGDRFVIRIWSPGDDPNVDEWLYKASGDLGGGQIKIHS